MTKSKSNRPLLCVIFLFAWLWLGASEVQAESKWNRYSAQTMALTPNAGGQQAIALRWLDSDREWTVFGNDYLRAGGAPLIGGSYGWRFDLLKIGWPVQPYVQLALGGSSAGPFGEITWGTNLFWIGRIDFSTQAFLTLDRVVAWSYPFWAGVSFPL